MKGHARYTVDQATACFRDNPDSSHAGTCSCCVRAEVEHTEHVCICGSRWAA